MSVEAILKTHPRPAAADVAKLVRCIDECGECEATCTVCADASLAEDDVAEMVRCIRLCLDCADACDATRRVLSRQTNPDPITQRAVVEACVAACRASAAECEKHESDKTIQACGKICRECAEACRKVSKS